MRHADTAFYAGKSRISTLFRQSGLASNYGDDKDARAANCRDLRFLMASLDAVSIAILLGAVLLMAGILSSLLALRFARKYGVR